ncbi:MAG TPA: hypothetical protein VE641_02850 [Chthoniobacterales bacterium]|nr:hypothetical protein [Chthoniobacterales bacterium]
MGLTEKDWAKTWEKAGLKLEAIRRREIGSSNTVSVILSFSDAFESAIQLLSHSKTSGLIEMQRVFRRIHLANGATSPQRS